MENKFEPLNKSNILLAEKEVSENKISSFKPAEKKETAKKILFENNEPQKRVESELNKNPRKKTLFEFEATKSFINNENESLETTIEKKTLFEKESLVNSPKSEKDINILNLQKSTSLNSESNAKNLTDSFSESFSKNISEDEINKNSNSEIPNNELFVFKTKEKEFKEKEKEDKYSTHQKKPNPGLKSRLKILFFGFVAILVCFLGWSIYNAVEIETLRSQMQTSNKVYAVNIVNYIKTIAKSDDLTSSESLINLEQLSDANIIPIAPKVEPLIEYQKTSNWFDRICNWLSNIFK